LRAQGLSRPLSTSAALRADVQEPPAQKAAAAAAEATPTPSTQDLDPNTVGPEFEATLMKSGVFPIGSRRRRLAIRTMDNVPFEQLPYQAFQEARKILAADREQKVTKIKVDSEKLSKLMATDASEFKGGQQSKDAKILGLRRQVERLKILADINDPVVKKRFEDGLGEFAAHLT
jgi:large subunit ribosomal protein L35